MFDAIKAELIHHYQVFTLDFSGHGDAAGNAVGFSIAGFAAEVLHFMDHQQIEQASIFGYSMGGYVALYLASHHPERLQKVATLATKMHWDIPTANKEVAMLDPEKLEEKVPQLANALKARHIDKDWKKLVRSTAEMLQKMGEEPPLRSEDFQGLKIPVLLLLGDRDKMVSLEETNHVFQKIPGAQMGMIPATPHPLEQVNGKLLGTLLHHFFED